jgi:hypothetical protein
MFLQLKDDVRKQYTDSELMEMKRWGLLVDSLRLLHRPNMLTTELACKTCLHTPVLARAHVFPSCFDQIDLDSGGTLDSSELQQAFVAMGETIGMEDLEKVIAEVGLTGHDHYWRGHLVHCHWLCGHGQHCSGNPGCLQVDENGNGEVEFDEFVQMVRVLRLEVPGPPSVTALMHHGHLVSARRTRSHYMITHWPCLTGVQHEVREVQFQAGHAPQPAARR